MQHGDLIHAHTVADSLGLLSDARSVLFPLHHRSVFCSGAGVNVCWVQSQTMSYRNKRKKRMGFWLERGKGRTRLRNRCLDCDEHARPASTRRKRVSKLEEHVKIYEFEVSVWWFRDDNSVADNWSLLFKDKSNRRS